MSHNIALVISF